MSEAWPMTLLQEDRAGHLGINNQLREHRRAQMLRPARCGLGVGAIPDLVTLRRLHRVCWSGGEFSPRMEGYSREDH